MTFHRALGFVDRASMTEDSPLRVVMASEGKQADGIDLRMSGADLARFRANPVLGYGHSYYGRMNLPIGRVVPETIAIEGTQLAADLEFDQEDEFARLVERKMRGGYLNAVSIGFDVLQWESAEDNYWRGGVATKWEQTELSVVPVPMDAAAVVTAGRGLDLADPGLITALRDLSEAEFDGLVARLRMLTDVLAPARGGTITPARIDLKMPTGDTSGVALKAMLRDLIRKPALPANDTPPPPASGVSETARLALVGPLEDFTKESHA